MNRLCYITRNYRNLNGAGNKAKTDNEDTLKELGATNLGLRRTFYAGKIVTFFIDLTGIVKYVFCIRRDDFVLLQYPVKKYFSFLCNVARLRGARTIALIHDLGSFRRRKLTEEKEIRRLMHADYVIASNNMMKSWLKEHGYQHPIGSLGLFDYRSPAESQYKESSISKPIRLVYAGALAMRKNAFLLQLAQTELSYELHIYGNRNGLPNMPDNDNIIFHPFTPADDFIANVDADFGFVWDGDSLENCSGNFGEYLHWNSPHKVSFYIRANLPVIIWKQAAVAPIIEQEGIGICIDSIADLGTALSTITDGQIQQMRTNVRRVSEQLNNGNFLTHALNEALDNMYKHNNH